jgi:hypothetical protein
VRVKIIAPENWKFSIIYGPRSAKRNGLLGLSAAANDAHHTCFVFTSPSRAPNRIVSNRDNHCQAPSGSEKDSKVGYEKEKRCYKNQE